MGMTTAETISYVRLIAKNAGLTFKVDDTARLNGGRLYKFTDRVSGRHVFGPMRLGTALDNACSGYIESYNKKTGRFDGLDD